MSSEERITPNDLLDAMFDANVLEVFCRLPEESQEEFREWVGKARDDESHWRRIDALVLAMRSGLLKDHSDREGETHSKVVE